MTEKKPYNPEKYHFFRDKETLERYLKNGYKSLQEARNLYNDPDYTYIKTKQQKTSDDLDFLLLKQQGVIKKCRSGIGLDRCARSSSCTR